MTEDDLDKQLGSDPFHQSDGTLPYLLKLRERTLRRIDAALNFIAAGGEGAPES